LAECVGPDFAAERHLLNTNGWSVNSSWTTAHGTNYMYLTSPTGNLFFRLTQP
jgi:hypothetical protein